MITFINHYSKVNLKKKVIFILGILLTIVSLWIIFNSVEINLLVTNLLKFNYKFFFTLIIFTPLIMLVRSWRWKILLSLYYPVELKTLFLANYIGQFMNNILPLRIGEVVRVELIKQKEGVSRGFMIGTIFTEKILDSIILLCFLFISFFSLPFLQNIYVKNLWNFVIFILLFIIIISVLLNRTIIKSILSRIPRFAERMNNIYENFQLSIDTFRNAKTLSTMFLTSLLIWILSALGFFIIALGLNIHLSFFAYLFISASAAFGMIIPSAPSNIGVYHGVVMLALLLFIPGENEKALSFAIISHGWTLISSSFLGLISIYLFTNYFTKNGK